MRGQMQDVQLTLDAILERGTRLLSWRGAQRKLAMQDYRFGQRAEHSLIKTDASGRTAHSVAATNLA